MIKFCQGEKEKREIRFEIRHSDKFEEIGAIVAIFHTVGSGKVEAVSSFNQEIGLRFDSASRCMVSLELRRKAPQQNPNFRQIGPRLRASLERKAQGGPSSIR